jgi:hypothetical protein
VVRTILIAAALMSVIPPRVAHASGHGPVFGGATPTLGKGGWQFDQALMGRSTEDATERTLRSMISFGITERLQISASVPVPLGAAGAAPVGRMTASMSDAPTVEATLGWRFQTRPVGQGARLESTMYVGGAAPVVGSRGGIRATGSTSIAVASGYASRIHYLWAAAGLERRRARGGDRWGNVAYYSLVYGYRPPALRLDYPKPDLRFFVEAQGESNGHTQLRGARNPNSGGRLVLVGPTTLLLYKQYGLEGGVLFPVVQRPNGVQARERYRLVVNASYFFWIH